MSVLVTGGTGLLGSAVVDALLRHSETVVVYDRQIQEATTSGATGPVSFVPGDVTDPAHLIATMQQHGIQRVVHLAGLVLAASAKDPVAAVRINAVGTGNVFDAAVQVGVRRVVFTSSTGVYGHGATYHGRLVTEDDPPIPATQYGSIKRVCEIMAQSYRDAHALDVVVVRPPLTYGPGTRVGGPGGLADTVRQASTGSRAVFSLVTQNRGFASLLQPMYSLDIAETIVTATLQDAVSPLYNPPVDPPVSVEHIFGLLQEIAPGVEFVLDTSRQLGPAFVAPQVDGSLARRELGVPRHSLADGLAELLEHFRAADRSGTDRSVLEEATGGRADR